MVNYFQQWRWLCHEASKKKGLMKERIITKNISSRILAKEIENETRAERPSGEKKIQIRSEIGREPIIGKTKKHDLLDVQNGERPVPIRTGLEDTGKVTSLN
jgi:hypothetical protein